MSRKDVNIFKYVAVFAVASLIFIAGLAVGDYFNDIKMNSLDTTANNIRSSVLGMELEHRLRAENPCSVVNSSRFTAPLGEISRKLTYMEEQLGKNNPRVLNLKEYYSMLEIRHWLFLQNARSQCNGNYSLVLYFYSNKKGECEMCDEQGHVLSYLHDKDPRFNIYSFDINIENPALEAVKEIYDINETPTVVIDGEVYPGFRGKRELVQKLDLEV